jgi:hypothetical protein
VEDVVVAVINFARTPGTVLQIPRRSLSLRRCRLRGIDQRAMEMVSMQRMME